jgi:uncharacterized protein with von Willebrand factor type A (vWA) domain
VTPDKSPVKAGPKALTKLKDLASRAGRWLGLTTPAALATRAIEADRFDQMEWREVHDQATALREMEGDLSETHHYTGDLLADVWTAAYKATPTLRDRTEMQASRTVNHQAVSSLLDCPEFTELRRETAGDPYAAALAVISQRERLTRLLEHAEDAQQAAEQAEQAVADAAEAAEQVADALEQAAAGADEDGEVPDEQAQAVDDAIEQAEQAEQAAAAAADAAARALAAAAPRMRAEMRAAAADATEQVRAEAALMSAWGVTPGQLQRMDFAARDRLAQRLRGGRMGAFADLIGRFRQMATGERARRMENAPGELVGITLGADVDRLIPSELAALGVPALRADFAARLAENRLMEYETRGEQTAGRGAIIAVVDCSYSMTDQHNGITREAWAKACTLALLDQARNSHPRRDFAAVLFSSPHETATFTFPAREAVAVTDVVDLTEHFFGGGTDYMTPLEAAAQLLETEYSTDGRQKGDIVLITDGECHITEDWMRAWHEAKTRLAFRVFGVSVAHSPGPVLDALTDTLHTITDLTDPGTTREMFHTI